MSLVTGWGREGEGGRDGEMKGKKGREGGREGRRKGGEGSERG